MTQRSDQNHLIKIRAGNRSGDNESSTDPRISWSINDGSSNQVQQWLTGVDFNDNNDYKISSGTGSSFSSIDDECLVVSKTTGDIRIPKNLIVDGDFIVEGKKTFINSDTVMEDNMQLGMNTIPVVLEQEQLLF